MAKDTREYALGRRIVVWGATGSGKTTLAGELGESLGLGVVDLDAIRHADGWDSTPWDEFRSRLTERLDGQPEGWVIAGSYSAISDVYLSRTDTVLWLHLPWRVSFWRLLKRSISRSMTQKPFYEGSPARESFRRAFLSRESILWWSISHHRSGVRSFRARIATLPPGVRVYELQTAKQVKALLQSAEQRETQLIP